MSESPITKHPAFDADGYPTDETLFAIEHWPVADVPGLFAYLREAWRLDHGKWDDVNGTLRLATGGWSGNEDLIAALRHNGVVWSLCWESSHRGGLEVFRVRGLR